MNDITKLNDTILATIDPMPAKPRFITDGKPVKAWSYGQIKRFFNDGHHPVFQNMHPDGLTEYEQGVAFVGEVPPGENALLTTNNIEDAELEHRFELPDGTMRSVPERDVTLPRSRREVGTDILGDGSIYKGQFVKQRGEGENSNYNHFLGIAGWKQSSAQLVHSLLDRFSDYHRQDFLESGLVMQHDPLTWTSREIVYAARPMMTWNLHGHRVQKTNEKGELLYRLMTLTAPMKGWNAARLYHENFTKRHEGILSKINSYALRKLIRLSSYNRRNLTLAEMQGEIVRNFEPTTKLLRRGDLAHLPVGEDGKPVPQYSAPWVKGQLRRVFSTAVFGLNDISKMDLVVNVGVPIGVGVATTVGEAMLKGSLEEITPLAVTTTLSSLAILRFLPLWFAHSKREIFEHVSFHNIIHNFWAKGTKQKDIPQQFEKVRPDIFKYMRVLTRYDLGAKLRVPGNKVSAISSRDKSATISMLNGPYGSMGRAHDIGHHVVGRVDECRKTSGLEIEYWQSPNVAFSRNPKSDQLPKSLVDCFGDPAKPIRAVWTIVDDEGCTDYNVRMLSQQEYDTVVDELAKQPEHVVAKLAQKALPADYPIPPIPDAEDDGYSRPDAGPDVQEEAADAAEALEKVLEVFSRGPH